MKSKLLVFGFVSLFVLFFLSSNALADTYEKSCYYEWNSTGNINETVTITASISDSSNSSVSDSSVVEVLNETTAGAGSAYSMSGDTLDIQITSSANGTEVSGLVNITISAAGPNELGDMSLSIEGNQSGSAFPISDSHCSYTSSGDDDVSCNDTDGGKDYYTEGRAIIEDEGGDLAYHDECVIPGDESSYYTKINGVLYERVSECSGEDCYLAEGDCESRDDSNSPYTVYQCPNGCEDGACKENETSCEDSDGGRDYNEIGVVTYDNSETPDYCYSEDDLREGYCENGEYKYERYECQYGCIGGECLMSYEEGEKFKIIKNSVQTIEFNGLEYTIDAPHCTGINPPRDMEISYGNNKVVFDKTFFEKKDLGNGDYMFVRGCPATTDFFYVYFIGRRNATTTTTSTTTTVPEVGYDRCEYNSGWSEPESSAQNCGWSTDKGYVEDCCCCYLRSHIHDLQKTFNSSKIKIEYKPGFTKGCESPMNVYSSVDGEDWDRFYKTTVEQETWSPKTTYTKEIKVPNKFRYIKIYIPDCYNDYSSAKVISSDEEDYEEHKKEIQNTSTTIEPEEDYKESGGGSAGGGVVKEKNKTQEEENETKKQEVKTQGCNGCQRGKKCFIYGTRMKIKNTTSYCGLEGNFEPQKKTGESCQNDYECKTNFCSEGECYNIKEEMQKTQSLMQRILTFFRKLFG